jgi:hypothetical protein
MSYQSIIDQHAAAMTARHEAIDNTIQEQAETRANEMNERVQALADSLEQTGSTLGSITGAYRLGRGVYKAYQKRGIKGAAETLKDKVTKAKGDIKNVKDDDEGGEGGAGAEGEAGDEAGDLARATTQSIRDRFTRLTGQTGDTEAPTGSQPTGTDADDPTDVSSRLDNLTGPTDEPTEVNLGSDADLGDTLNFKIGSVAEPEDLQVARYTQMAQDVFNRNRAKGLDIEGNPLSEEQLGRGLKPAERVLADVTGKSGQTQLDQEQPSQQGGADETNDPALENSAAEPSAAPTDQASTAQQGAESVTDAESAVKDPAASRFLDGSSGQPAGDTPATQSAPSADGPTGGVAETDIDDQLAKQAAQKMSSGARTALQNTGSELEEGAAKAATKVGGGLLDSAPELLTTLGEGLSWIPVIGEVASVGLGIAGLIESLTGNKDSVAKEKAVIPVAPTSSGIDPQAIGQVQKENIS